MRQLSEEELRAIAALACHKPGEREIIQSQRRVLVQLGQQVPVIHQVLFS